jgi:hypothetical protein
VYEMLLGRGFAVPEMLIEEGVYGTTNVEKH